MTLVIDASLVLAWYFEDERTPPVIALLQKVSVAGAIVPLLWRLEVANGLQISLRRNRIDAAFRDASLADLALLPITVDPELNTYAWSTTLRLADQYRLTMYDAAYLELAQRRELPLATLDRELRAAAQQLGLALAPV